MRKMDAKIGVEILGKWRYEDDLVEVDTTEEGKLVFTWADTKIIVSRQDVKDEIDNNPPGYEIG